MINCYRYDYRNERCLECYQGYKKDNAGDCVVEIADVCPNGVPPVNGYICYVKSLNCRSTNDQGVCIGCDFGY